MFSSSDYLNPKAIMEEAGFSADMIVGDFGCGSGYKTFAASEIVGRHGAVYAVDILKSPLEHIRSQASERGITNVKTVWSNLEILGATKIQDQSLDAGLLVNVLFMSTEHRGVLTEVRRMLKNGALLLIIEWKSIATPFGPPLSVRVPKNDIKNLLADMSFNRIKEFDPSGYHYALLYRA